MRQSLMQTKHSSVGYVSAMRKDEDGTIGMANAMAYLWSKGGWAGWAGAGRGHGHGVPMVWSKGGCPGCSGSGA